MSFADDVIDLMGAFSISFAVIIAGQSVYGFMTRNPQGASKAAKAGADLLKKSQQRKVK